MIIGISGKINSGKDTTGRLLLKNISEDVFNITKQWDSELFISNYEQFEWILAEKTRDWKFKKFAFKLKMFAGLIIGKDVEMFEDRDFKKSTLPAMWDKKMTVRDEFNTPILKEEQMTVRDLLIALGDGCRRMVHPNIWINALCADYNPLDNPKWIVNDLRYKNEAVALKNLAEEHNDQCFLIRINSDRAQIINNDSETDLDDYTDFDFYIENNKDTTVTDLEAQIRAILIKIQWAKVKEQIKK